MLIHVDYFDKDYLDWHHPNRKNSVLYQLAYSDGISSEQQCFSQRKTFYDMALDMFKFLKSSTAFTKKYELDFSKRTVNNILSKEKKILEEIVALHNDFASPRQRSSRKYKMYI